MAYPFTRGRLEYAAQHNVPVKQSRRSIYSRDRNIWHISHEGGILEDPWQEPAEDMFVLTVRPKRRLTSEYVEIDFRQGVPVRLNGASMGPVELVSALNKLGGAHGVGRVDLVENRLVGMKSRGVYETPGGTILLAAHQGLESLTLDGETMHYKDIVALKYAEMVYNGRWYTPLREALDAFVRATQQHVSGRVRVKLFREVVVAHASRPQPSVDLLPCADDGTTKDEGLLTCTGYR